MTKWLQDNAVVHFKDDQPNPIFSYVVKDADGHLTDIVEKQKFQTTHAAVVTHFLRGKLPVA